MLNLELISIESVMINVLISNLDIIFGITANEFNLYNNYLYFFLKVLYVYGLYISLSYIVSFLFYYLYLLIYIIFFYHIIYYDILIKFNIIILLSFLKLLLFLFHLINILIYDIA